MVEPNNSYHNDRQGYLSKVVKKIPLRPGVYIMKAKDTEVLYVGKASSLRKRVSSYFSHRGSLKNDLLMEHVADIDYIECDTEEQALILEAALIKEKKPKYNVALRDDKGYPYIEITAEVFPRIYITRKRQNKNSLYFGPYPKVKILKSVLNLLRRVFPFCSCRCFKKTECLFAHLKLCPAPCAEKISAKAYKENIQGIIKILKGQRQELSDYLRDKMQKLSQENKFEEAKTIRDKLVAINNLYRGKTVTHELISLKKILNLPSIPLYIEAIDISSLSGRQATGSVVVFRNTVADKSSYRRYRIRAVTGADDYAMVAEVVRRRYSRLLEQKIKMPDLVVIDGGLGHVQSAKRELTGLGLDIPLVGIAKQNEELWLPAAKSALVIPKDDISLHFIQRIRDEAHRFARKYHLLLRRKKLVESRG